MRVRLPQLGRRGRAFFAHAGLSYVYQGVVALQGFLLIPLYLRYLGSAYYGYWLATGGALFALTFVNLGLAPAINREIAARHAAGEHQLSAENFITGLVLHLLMGLLLLGLAATVSRWLPSLLHFPDRLSSALLSAFLVASVAFALAMANDYMRGAAAAALQPAGVTIALIVAQLLGVAANVFLLIRGWGAISIAVGMLVTQLGALLGNMLFLLRARAILLSRLPSRQTVAAILGIVPSLLGARFALRLSQQIEPTLTSLFIGPEMTTLYMVNRKLCDLLDTVANVVWGALMMPLAHFFESAPEPRRSRTVISVLLTLFSLSTVLMAGYILIDRPFVALWVAGKANASLTLVAAIAFARLAESMFNCVSEMHTVMGAPRTTARGTLYFVAARLVLAVILLRLTGLNGLPLAVASAGAIFAVVMLRELTRRRIQAKPGSTKIGMVASAAIGMLAAAAALSAGLDAVAKGVLRLVTGVAIIAPLGLFWFTNRWKSFRGRGT